MTGRSVWRWKTGSLKMNLENRKQALAISFQYLRPLLNT